MAAVVGVGPIGTQAIVAVLQLAAPAARARHEASLALTDRVRQVLDPDIDVASVLLVPRLPVDRRHNSKVDRTALARWAERTLAGERVAPP